jgi:acetoin:2,6-dichlorophenolindophenol oxidoreductase subunit alpha
VTARMADDLAWALFEAMLLMRRFEEAVIDLAKSHQFGHYHLYTGQEATGAAALSALQATDFITTTHRNHGHVLARGADPGAAFAEILGRSTGLVGGRGGTIHLCDPSLGFLATSGIVGGAISLGIGAAFACKYRREGAIAMAFFGDGALEEGISFEALNVAALWKLPVVFVCENNSAEAWGRAKGGYPTLIHSATDLCAIPRSLGIESVRIDGADIEAAFATATEAVARCRNAEGPVFIEAATRRWAGSAPLWPEQVTGNTQLRMATGDAPTDGPHKEWYELYDPVLRLARALAGDAAGKTRLHEIDARVSARIAAGLRFALESPLPPAASAVEHVFG